ncbi:hypothetical protein JCM11491_001569 [Sporobolomyces phaffii]
MQYPQGDPYASSVHPEPIPSSVPHPPPSQPSLSRPGPSANAYLHGSASAPAHHAPPHPAHTTSSHFSHHAPHLGRGGFFGPWSNQYLPHAPWSNQYLPHAPAYPPSFPPHGPYGSNVAQQPQYHFYRRCGGWGRRGRGRVLPLLIVAGAGYFAYRNLGNSIDQVRAQVDQVRAGGIRLEDSKDVTATGGDGRGPTAQEFDGRGRHWRWDARRQEKREVEEKRAELERKKIEFEAKMKEWEAAFARGKEEKKPETRWI